MRRKTDLPKGVWFQKKRLAGGKVVRYGYFGRGPGTEPLGLEGSAEFHARLAEAMSRAPVEGRVSFLIWRYLNDDVFKKKRPLTQRDYRKHLDAIKLKFGDLSLKAMASPTMTDHLYKWRDKLAETSPRQADYAMSVLSLLLGWGVKRGLLTFNRAAGIEDVYHADRSEKTWSEEQEAAFLAVASPSIARGFLLAVEAGLSPEDVYVIPWSAVQGNVLIGRRLKTGVPFAVPISPKLRRMLDEAPRGDSVTILTKEDGFPFDPKGNGFRSLFRGYRVAAGIEDRTHKDLRGTFITRRRAMGWTAEETALCSGHPIAGEKGAQGAYVDRIIVAKANAERLWSRWYGPEREQKLQTGLQTGTAQGGLSH